MKLALNLSVVSSKQLAVIVWGSWALVCFCWPGMHVGNRLFVAAVGGLLGTGLALQRFWLVWHSSQKVLRQIQHTLQMCCVGYEVDGLSVKVTATGTRVSVWGWRCQTIVSFEVQDPKCRKERFLLEVLLKHLRLIGKNQVHG